jgi:hypothetical protein
VSGDMVRCWCCGVGLAPKGFWCWWLWWKIVLIFFTIKNNHLFFMHTH